MSTQREIFPDGNLTDSSLYTVDLYYPERQTCDLFPVFHQRGALKDVPIRTAFGGSWEVQSSHQPPVVRGYDPASFGNAARGPRWGMNFPIEAGDLAVVEYLGASQSDPIVTGFIFWKGNYGVPWTANQILSQANDYTRLTPEDDDLVSGRFDILLPSGAWLRSTQSGSWTMATAPADRAKAFITLHSDGNIRIKGRGEEEYTVHLEFDPTQNFGRIVLGNLESGSSIEFKDGNITIKAEKSLLLKGADIQGDARPQAMGGAIDALMNTPSPAIADGDLPGQVAQAAGEMAMQSVSTAASVALGVVAITAMPLPTPALLVLKQESMAAGIAASMMSNPAIDGALRGRISDLLTDPSALMEAASSAFAGSLPNDLAIGGALSRLLGSNVLSGGLGSISSPVDLGSLAMVKDLGIPSWAGTAVQAAIAGGSPLSIGLAITPEILPSLTDSQLIDQVMQFVGGAALDGGNPFDVRQLLEDTLDELGSSVKSRIEDLLPKIDGIPIKIPRGSSGQDFARTAAQRLGKRILKGGNFLGGAAQLFDRGQLEGLGMGGSKLAAVMRVAGQIESYASNPHELAGSLPSSLMPHLETISQIPVEIRDALSRVPQNLLKRLPNLASGQLGRLEGVIFKAADFVDDGEGCQVFEELQDEFLTSILPDWLPEERELGALLQSAPQQIQQLVSDLPNELIEEMAGLPRGDFTALMQNPAAIMGGLDTGMIVSLFGGMTSPNAGAFDMRVSKWATFGILPQGTQPQQELGSDTFHEDTTRTPIERTTGYGSVRIPGWSQG